MSDPTKNRGRRAAPAEGRQDSRADSELLDSPEVLEGLLDGNEDVFARVVRAHHSSLVRVAMAYVPSREIAEEVAQEAWTVVVEGLARFEGRSTLKTWLFAILLNRARTRGARESRLVPLSAFESEDSGRCELLESSSGQDILSPGRTEWLWGSSSKTASPEDNLLLTELNSYRARAIAQLPYRQRVVITLRDVEGWSSEEVCQVLDIRSTHQRVLLHRARIKVRNSIQKVIEGSSKS